MAETPTIKRGDTWPPLKGVASDENGLLPLQTAQSIKLLLKSGNTLITGAVTAINPPDADGNNWQYVWAVGDTNTPGDYSGELEITWATGQVETVPNGPNVTNPDGYIALTIEADLG